MPRIRPYGNYRLLRSMTSKMREIGSSREAQYLIVYSFLYKYCSDNLKDKVCDFCRERSVTIDEVYRDDFLRDFIKRKALNECGFFISDQNCFIDEIIDENYANRFFLHQFYIAFSENVEFDEDSRYGEYFKLIFDNVGQAVNFNKFEFEDPSHLLVKEIIYSISRLDIRESDFPFAKVFDKICQSRLIRADHDPDYINDLISSIVLSKAISLEDIYNPFLNDASLLLNLYCNPGFACRSAYAKSQDNLTYCCSLVKLTVNGFDLNAIHSEFGSPFEPLDDMSLKFDVIMSRLPPITSKNIRKMSVNQSYEVMKRNKAIQLKSLLADKMNIDEESFENNAELNNAVENLIEKMDFDLEIDRQFVGEYESLKDSEYLFLINMINSLKDDGIMVVSMHQSFLVKNSLETLRKFLTFEKNYVDAIISIPDGLSRQSRQEIIMVFRKNRNTDEIVFIDMSKEYKTKRSPYAVPGVFAAKNLVLADSTISEVLDVYTHHRIIEKFSNVVRISDAAANGFNLSISRYVDTFEGRFIDLKDLKNQKTEIDQNREMLNEKIEKMMEELGIRL